MSSAPLLGLPGRIKVLIDRLTASRASNLDNLNATVSSRAPASTAVSNATLTNPRIANLDNLNAPVQTIDNNVDTILSRIPGTVLSATVNSVQRGVGTLPNASGTSVFTLTISAVDMSKSVLLVDVYDSGIDFYARLNSSTQIRIQYSSISAAASEVKEFSWQVVEYN